MMQQFRTVYIMPFICLGFYTGFFFNGEVRDAPNKFNYYKEMALSVADGKLDISCPAGTNCHDLLNVNGRYYFYYGAIPTLVFIPLVMIWGRATPDSLIAACIGAFNVFLFIMLYFRIRERYPRGRTNLEDWYYTILWGLGTVHFYISMHGDVWHLAKSMAQTFLLTAALFLFAKHKGHLLFSGIFLAFAFHTRYSLIFGSIFFLLIIWKKATSRQDFLKKTAVFALPSVILITLSLVYNYMRFGDALEIGASYMKLEVKSGVAERAALYGKISIQNLIHNFYLEIMKSPEFDRTFPFIKLNPHGFGIIWATPVYLMAIPAIMKLYNYYRNGVKLSFQSVISFSCLFSMIAIAITIFAIPSHGYMQFAARYTLDFQLFLILLILLHRRVQNPRIMWVMLGLSVYMNTVGAFLFMNFFRKGIS